MIQQRPAAVGTRLPGGFSLVELLLTLTLIGMLFAFALPGWRSSMQATRRADAMLSLSRLAALQQQFRAAHGRYATLDELGRSTSTDGHYRLTSTVDETGYRLTATVLAAGAQGKDELCWRFTLDAAGRRYAFDRQSADRTRYCWKTG